MRALAATLPALGSPDVDQSLAAANDVASSDQYFGYDATLQVAQHLKTA